MKKEKIRLDRMPQSIAIISSDEQSLLRFKGSFISFMLKQGVIVYALAPYHDNNIRESLKDMGAITVNIPISRGKSNIFIDFFRVLKKAYIIRKIRPSVTLVYFIKPVIFGSFAAFLARVPHRVAMIEGLGFFYTKSKEQTNYKKKITRFAISLLYKVALKTAHKIIFLNNDDKEEFVYRGIVKKCKTDVLGGIGINLQEWSFSGPSISPFAFIFVGRILREKGIFELMSAFKRINKEFPDTELFILGDFDGFNPGTLHEKTLDDFVNSVNCTWIRHTNPIDWLIKSSVFVLPSYREGVPRSAQEALAVGLPIITTDVPGCRETVINGKNGLLIPSCNPVALYDAMKNFLLNRNVIFDMSKISREIAETRFDENVCNERLLHMLL